MYPGLGQDSFIEGFTSVIPTIDISTIDVGPPAPAGDTSTGTSIWDKIVHTGTDIFKSIFGSQGGYYPGTTVGVYPRTGTTIDWTTVALVGLGVYLLVTAGKKKRR